MMLDTVPTMKIVGIRIFLRFDEIELCNNTVCVHFTFPNLFSKFQILYFIAEQNFSCYIFEARMNF